MVLNCNSAKVEKKNGQIIFTAKAFNGRVVLEWISRCMPDLARQNPDDQRLALLASCAQPGLLLELCAPSSGQSSVGNICDNAHVA